MTPSTYTFSTNQLCSTDNTFVVYHDGAVTVNLDGVTDSSVTSVVIPTLAASNCKQLLTSLTINPRTSGTTVKTLSIGDYAFSQGSAEVRLASVTFPTRITTLTIGAHAFEQQTEGDNSPSALSSVSFPSGLVNLEVGDYAFSQYNQGANSPNALSSVDFSSGLTSLSLGYRAFRQHTGGTNSDNALTSVTFPSGLTTLTTGTGTFVQEATGDDSFNALKSVTFPSSLTELSLGVSSFSQEASKDTALSSVSFPSGLLTLTIEDDAFRQEAGDTAVLSSVSFPTSLESLTIGETAFAQLAQTKTNLHSVTFPDGLTSLDLATGAFAQLAPDAVLTWVSFPNTLTNLAVGTQAFVPYCGAVEVASLQPARLKANTKDEPLPCRPIQVIFRATTQMSASATLVFPADALPESSSWAWFGADGTPLRDAWSNAEAVIPTTATLLGYRTVGFETEGGTLASSTVGLPSSAAASTWLVYPDGSHTVRPTVTTTGPLTTNGWKIALPKATRSGYRLAGWCTSIGCAAPQAAGTYFLSRAASQTLHASWTAIQPPTPSTPPAFTNPAALPSATAGRAYRLVFGFTGSAVTTCTLADGTLPTGLTLRDCVISGTPTKAGTSNFTIAATNAEGTTAKAFRLTIAAGQSSDNDHLASTGNNPTPLALIGALLAAIGAGLTLTGRRRTR